MSDDPVPTVRERMLRAGIDEERLAEHHAAGRVRANGEPVADLDAPAPNGTRLHLSGD